MDVVNANNVCTSACDDSSHYHHGMNETTTTTRTTTRTSPADTRNDNDLKVVEYLEVMKMMIMNKRKRKKRNTVPMMIFATIVYCSVWFSTTCQASAMLHPPSNLHGTTTTTTSPSSPTKDFEETHGQLHSKSHPSASVFETIEEDDDVIEDDGDIIYEYYDDDDDDDDDDETNNQESYFGSNNRRPYMVVCTVDGNVMILDALDGTEVGTFNSGEPLVGPSGILMGQRRIVPGLDGRLYVSNAQGEVLQPLEITVVDVLNNPVRTCGTTDEGCGIVTATKSISFYALDANTGHLLWYQSRDGATVYNYHHHDGGKSADDDDHDDHDEDTDTTRILPPTNTVLLQREDFLVQQLSTRSGHPVWNASLGTFQALEFGDTNRLPPSGEHVFLPDGEKDSSKSFGNSHHGSLLVEENHDGPLERHVLPAVLFGRGGTRLTAVHPTVGYNLWTEEFPSLIASVFGLHDLSWQALTVLEETEHGISSSSSSTDATTRSSHQLPAPKYPLSSLTDAVEIYTPQAETTRFLDRLWSPDRFLAHLNIYLRRENTLPATKGFPLPMTYQQHARLESDIHDQLQLYQQRPFSNLLLSPNYPPPSLPPDLTGTVQPQGLFLTWPVVVGIIVSVLVLGGILFRILYMKKKKEWLQLLQNATNTSAATVPAVMTRHARSTSETEADMVGVSFQLDDSHSSTASAAKQPAKVLRRCQSLPEVSYRRSNDGETSSSIFVRTGNIGTGSDLYTSGYRSGDDDDDAMGEAKETTTNKSQVSAVGAETKNKTSTTTTDQRSTTSSELLGPSSEGGVDFLIDGIPLIRYSRYESEFHEGVALGKGGFGTVFRCKNVLDGREYAIKKVFIRYDPRLPQKKFSERLQRTLREVKSLALLDHPNIVRYYTAWLELEKKREGGYLDGTNNGATSDYYFMSPTTSVGGTFNKPPDSVTTTTPTVDRVRRRSSLLRITLGKNNNPLGGWNPFSNERTTTTNQTGGGNGDDGDEDSIRRGSFARSYIPSPNDDDDDDDCGFTFDRGSITSQQQNSNIYWQPSATMDDYSKPSARYESSISGGKSSQLEESTTMFGMSTDERRNQQKENVHKSDAEQKRDIPADMTRHILYIQMQFCSQKTLADFLANKEARKDPSGLNAVDIPYALSLFLQVAQGVKHVHNQGLIHRDLKPNNCFIDETGTVKVGDFGLSRESSTDKDAPHAMTMTNVSLFVSRRSSSKSLLDGNVDGDGNGNGRRDGTGMIDKENTAGVGTRSYASPEQMKGSDYDSSTDIYSLGIILFELCYPMYTGMERTIVFNNLRNHIFPEQWQRNVQQKFPSLHSLLLLMLSSSPKNRPTADVVATKMQSILEGFTVTSLDKNVHATSTGILLRIESKTRDDVLSYTIQLFKEAVSPSHNVHVIQYGLRSGTNRTIMEFEIDFILPKHDEESKEVVADENNDHDHDVDNKDKTDDTNESSFTLSTSMKSQLANALISKVSSYDDILLIRQVTAKKY